MKKEEFESLKKGDKLKPSIKFYESFRKPLIGLIGTVISTYPPQGLIKLTRFNMRSEFDYHYSFWDSVNTFLKLNKIISITTHVMTYLNEGRNDMRVFWYEAHIIYKYKETL